MFTSFIVAQSTDRKKKKKKKKKKKNVNDDKVIEDKTKLAVDADLLDERKSVVDTEITETGSETESVAKKKKKKRKKNVNDANVIEDKTKLAVDADLLDERKSVVDTEITETGSETESVAKKKKKKRKKNVNDGNVIEDKTKLAVDADLDERKSVVDTEITEIGSETESVAKKKKKKNVNDGNVIEDKTKLAVDADLDERKSVVDTEITETGSETESVAKKKRKKNVNDGNVIEDKTKLAVDADLDERKSVVDTEITETGSETESVAKKKRKKNVNDGNVIEDKTKLAVDADLDERKSVVDTEITETGSETESVTNKKKKKSKQGKVGIGLLHENNVDESSKSVVESSTNIIDDVDIEVENTITEKVEKRKKKKKKAKERYAEVDANDNICTDVVKEDICVTKSTIVPVAEVNNDNKSLTENVINVISENVINVISENVVNVISEVQVPEKNLPDPVCANKSKEVIETTTEEVIHNADDSIHSKRPQTLVNTIKININDECDTMNIANKAKGVEFIDIESEKVIPSEEVITKSVTPHHGVIDLTEVNKTSVDKEKEVCNNSLDVITISNNESYSNQNNDVIFAVESAVDPALIDLTLDESSDSNYDAGLRIDETKLFYTDRIGESASNVSTLPGSPEEGQISVDMDVSVRGVTTMLSDDNTNVKGEHLNRDKENNDMDNVIIVKDVSKTNKIKECDVTCQLQGTTVNDDDRIITSCGESGETKVDISDDQVSADTQNHELLNEENKCVVKDASEIIHSPIKQKRKKRKSRIMKVVETSCTDMEVMVLDGKAKTLTESPNNEGGEDINGEIGALKVIEPVVKEKRKQRKSFLTNPAEIEKGDADVNVFDDKLNTPKSTVGNLEEENESDIVNSVVVRKSALKRKGKKRQSHLINCNVSHSNADKEKISNDPVDTEKDIENCRVHENACDKGDVTIATNTSTNVVYCNNSSQLTVESGSEFTSILNKNDLTGTVNNGENDTGKCEDEVEVLKKRKGKKSINRNPLSKNILSSEVENMLQTYGLSNDIDVNNITEHNKSTSLGDNEWGVPSDEWCDDNGDQLDTNEMLEKCVSNESVGEAKKKKKRKSTLVEKRRKSMRVEKLISYVNNISTKDNITDNDTIDVPSTEQSKVEAGESIDGLFASLNSTSKPKRRKTKNILRDEDQPKPIASFMRTPPPTASAAFFRKAVMKTEPAKRRMKAKRVVWFLFVHLCSCLSACLWVRVCLRVCVAVCYNIRSLTFVSRFTIS